MYRSVLPAGVFHAFYLCFSANEPYNSTDCLVSYGGLFKNGASAIISAAIDAALKVNAGRNQAYISMASVNGTGERFYLDKPQNDIPYTVVPGPVPDYMLASSNTANAMFANATRTYRQVS